MKRVIFGILILSLPGMIFGQSVQETQTDYTGFFGTSYVIEGDNSQFRFDILELDIAHKINDKFSLEGALAVENGQAGVEGILSMRLWENSSIKIGRFDIPFGYEFNRYDPHINKFESVSLMNTSLMNGIWNDEGINFSMSFLSFNMNVFVINGDASHKTGGIRLANNYFEPVEVGVSAASVLNSNQLDKDIITNVYGRMTPGDFKIRAEITSNQEGSSIEGAEEGMGYYISGLYDMEEKINLPVYFGTRYSSVNYDNGGSNCKVSAGLGYKITKTNLIKLFYGTEGDNSNITFETGVSF